MIADLDTLLIALYVELTDRIIASLGNGERRVGRPPTVTDAELVCLAVAQVLLRYDDERHWLRAALKQVEHLFPRMLSQSEYQRPPQGRRAADGGRTAMAGRSHPGTDGVAAVDGRHPSKEISACWQEHPAPAASSSARVRCGRRRQEQQSGWGGPVP